MAKIREEMARQIGTSIEQLRTKHGLSQKELASESEVSLQTIVTLEKGYVLPHTGTLTKLLKAMGEEELSI